ncbi:heavy-metal-associated domain-containing protein [Leucobacter insecticola]|uniref:Heavy-metal-associated domain-containing protein n=1 Tax=Leucobacter insecticola TaxID=2714934 RepID=A0A6G8FGX6_9MICO|nr:heavy-metal-associated domain-containing protein [Leucobacter insecticola]QIM15604.1 heavy-metal-associated domain-containing protein [Leucobacter insecticola]
MNAGARLALYGLGLVVAFGSAFGIAAAVAPDNAAADWTTGNEMNEHAADDTSATTEALKGLSLGAEGYLLSPVQAPTIVGDPGTLSFQILDPNGEAVSKYATAHEKDLHLIVVRSDGSQYRHVHPELDHTTGTWSTPWEWTEAGGYRVFADFTPEGPNAPSLTLARTVQVAGHYAPWTPQLTRVAEVDGFTVTVEGELVEGASSNLVVSVARDGKPVTTLEPYLGAFGHLVALREGDLAYLHVHPAGETPAVGTTSGPEIGFAASAPTVGSYLLYFDFQVEGNVHTAEFVLDAVHGDGSQHDAGKRSDSHTESH